MSRRVLGRGTLIGPSGDFLADYRRRFMMIADFLADSDGAVTTYLGTFAISF